ncbi:SEC-C metal-binding domain-containing protein [Pseudomonas shahriarae]|uniref:YecA/YgfB family protein n=1 Tax=Pseudomonas shahriarae TaxID=2745512 RepID=UPI002362798F|nr:SEC-C metal-binding domain-containing protein [Pseudomonas shahriarae]MDD0980262.1 SEC-C metal-binding domain-containing protein [Pseudomonas shahriarae]
MGKAIDISRNLFDLVNGHYQIGASLLNAINDPLHDNDIEEFRFKAQMHWCNVRGERFFYHQVKALESLILPQTELIESTFGISSKFIINEFSKIMHTQTHGMHDAFKILDHSRMAFIEFMKGEHLEEHTDLSPPKAYELFLKKTGSTEASTAAFDKMFGTGLFDLKKITDLPDSFLDKLSWSPGEDKDFQSEGEFKGWPLRIWPTFKRPFIKFETSYYCFDLHSLFDKIYRQLEKIIFSTTEKNKQAWIKIRNITSEQLPIDYLSMMLPDATIIKEAYYNVVDPSSGKQKTCETDGLFIYGDTLLILEIKAASFTYTSPTDDFIAFTNSLKTLIQNPINQGVRFLDFLNSRDEVTIYNNKKEEILKLKSSNFKNKIICAITLDPFTELAAQTQNLEKLGIDIGDAFSWSLSIDDLQVYSDIFTEPLFFLHYLEKRMRASKSKFLELDDELDHLGLYLAHNDYTAYAVDKASNRKARLRFNGYRSEIDIYFSELQLDQSTPNLLIAKKPARLTEIILNISKTTNGKPSKLSTYLLDINTEERNRIFEILNDSLTYELNDLKPLSNYGKTNLTIYPTNDIITAEVVSSAINHIQAVMLITKEPTRNLLIVQYSNDATLEKLHWEELSLNSIPNEKIEHLTLTAENLREKRIASAMKKNEKIGRNDPCPCLSNKKYKHCCLSIR